LFFAEGFRSNGVVGCLLVIDHDLFAGGGFKIGDHLGRFLGTTGMVDPEHGFGSAGVGEALVDVAVAAEVVDVVGALLPAAAPVGCNGDGLGGLGSMGADVASVIG